MHIELMTGKSFRPFWLIKCMAPIMIKLLQSSLSRWDFTLSGAGLAPKCHCRIGLYPFSAMEVTALLSVLTNGSRGACLEHCRQGSRLFQRVLCKQLIVQTQLPHDCIIKSDESGIWQLHLWCAQKRMLCARGSIFPVLRACPQLC